MLTPSCSCAHAHTNAFPLITLIHGLDRMFEGKSYVCMIVWKAEVFSHPLQVCFQQSAMPALSILQDLGTPPTVFYLCKPLLQTINSSCPCTCSHNLKIFRKCVSTSETVPLICCIVTLVPKQTQ